MQKREMIIRLLQEDIKHNMLLNGLYNIGINDNQNYVLDICSIVAALMDIPEGGINDKWMSKYHSVMLAVQPNMTSKEQISEAEILFESLSNLK